jgi:threonylcarbamoyladenosine tRNA methylthiotransferase CDKAL1
LVALTGAYNSVWLKNDGSCSTKLFLDKEINSGNSQILHVNEEEKKKKKVWIEAYGCSASIADAEMIAGLLESSGYDIATHESDSSLNLIVTCSVKDATEHRMRYRINVLSKSQKPLIVAGCLPKADRNIVEQINPKASLLGPHSIDKAVESVKYTLLGRKKVILDDSISDKINIPRIRKNPTISIVEIASGCMSQCTFCQTKLAKGYLKSYRIGDICRQIQSDIHDGCKEIWLSSTDNGCYGKDKGSNLVELLRACTSVNGDYKIRVGMMNPMYLPNMMEDLLEVFLESDKLFKFVHIPIQSGSERILRLMKRGHTVKTFYDLVRRFRKAIPNMTIATDIIVGFPSETEYDFQETLSVIRNTKPDIVNSSKYSARRGTESAKYNKIPDDIVKRRSSQLHCLIKQIALKRNSLWQNWTGDIVIDEHIDYKRNILMQGRNYAYKPVILSSSSELCKNTSLYHERFKIGNIIKVHIDGFSSHVLKGRVIPS